MLLVAGPARKCQQPRLLSGRKLQLLTSGVQADSGRAATLRRPIALYIAGKLAAHLAINHPSRSVVQPIQHPVGVQLQVFHTTHKLHQ